MNRKVLLGAAALVIGGCSPGVLVSSMLGESSWSLTADEDNALVDVQNVKFGTYPNPRGVKGMRVSVADDGTLCANDGQRSWCGGPLQGIPYLTVINVQPERFCVRVVDIYGNAVRKACQDGPPPESVLMGTPTEVTQPGAVPVGEGATGGDDVARAAVDGAAVGAKLFADALNGMLEKIGLKTRVAPPTGGGLLDFDRGDIKLGEGSCKDVLEYLDDEFSDDKPGTDDYVLGPEAIAECLDEGRCRVGQLVTRAMAEACKQLPGEVDVLSAETGIIGAGGAAVEELCTDDQPEIDRCVGSPLVLDLAQDGLQLQGLAGGVSFPLLGGRQLGVGWLAGSDDALLALDRDGDGRITSGRELFGEASGRHGFAALARLDANGDGVVSIEDPAFAELLAWRDDGDGRSARHELLPLRELGIRSIPLRHATLDTVDDFGNVLGLQGAATSERGEQIPVIDVWFRMQARD